MVTHSIAAGLEHVPVQVITESAAEGAWQPAQLAGLNLPTFTIDPNAHVELVRAEQRPHIGGDPEPVWWLLFKCRDHYSVVCHHPSNITDWGRAAVCCDTDLDPDKVWENGVE